jgi:hypothetical protein
MEFNFQIIYTNGHTRAYIKYYFHYIMTCYCANETYHLDSTRTRCLGLLALKTNPNHAKMSNFHYGATLRIYVGLYRPLRVTITSVKHLLDLTY